MVYVLIKDKFSGIDTLKILKKSANFCSCNGWYDFLEHVLEYILLIKLLLFDSFIC